MPTPHSRKVVVAGVKKVVIVGGTRTVTTPKEISTGEILFIGAHTVNTISLGGAAAYGTMAVVRASNGFDRPIFARVFATGTFFLAAIGVVLGTCIKETANRKAGRSRLAGALKSRVVKFIYSLITVLAALSLITTAYFNC
ncbi:hypothetical protein FRC03_005660 [Tulasnella sp. 419]|nr:hypothetical protein FRC03_005660 [Tulasnella sp. 419]